MTPERLSNVILAALVLAVATFAASRTAADPDLWGHVRFGQDILAARSLPSEDPYSFTSDRAWVNHEWLAEVLLATGYGAAGVPGLVAVKLAVLLFTLAAVWTGVRRAGVPPAIGTALLLVAIVVVHAQLIAIRPQLFSIALFAAVLVTMNRIREGHRRSWVWMPLAFALWANLHGGWIVGLAVLAVWSTVALGSDRARWGEIVGGMAIAAGGTLVTPYGLDLWRFLWETVAIGRADIADWQPLWKTPSHFLPWLIGALVPVFAWRRAGRASLSAVLPAVALGLMALRVVRLQGFFGLACVMLSAPFLAGVNPAQLTVTRPLSRVRVAVASLFASGIFVMSVFSFVRGASCLEIDAPALLAEWAPEPEAVRFLQVNALRGRLLCWFDYGELAIWHVAPRLKVSMDGRRETVYSDSVRNDHLRFYTSRDDASYARRLEADYVWLPNKLPVNSLLEREGWVTVFKGPKSSVHAKEQGRYVQPAPWDGPWCFPGP